MWKIDLEVPDDGRTAEQIRKKIDRYDVLSLDIFDTTLIRLVKSPTIIFQMMSPLAEKIGIQDFQKKRVECQRQAAAVHGLSTTLDEIYEVIGDREQLSESQRLTLMRHEVDLERKYTILNATIADILQYCEKHQKRVVFTSDMYLPQAMLQGLLQDKGVHSYGEIYSSCDYGKSKRQGNLFEVVYEHECQNLCRSDIKILHIGDSFRSDVFMARMNRHFSSLYMPRVHGTFEHRVESYTCSKFNSPIHQWAYHSMAPVVWLFCSWIEQKVQERSIQTLLFQTREGAFFFPLFNAYTRDAYATHIFYASRQSILAASADVNWKYLFSYLKNMRFGFIQNLFHLTDSVMQQILRGGDSCLLTHSCVMWERKKRNTFYPICNPIS